MDQRFPADPDKFLTPLFRAISCDFVVPFVSSADAQEAICNEATER